MKLNDFHIPVKRPHFSIKENKLYFLVSNRPYYILTKDEVNIWSTINGERTVLDIEKESPDSRLILSNFWEKQIIEVVSEELPEKRKNILVIEPHMDDAILSVGGTMWKLRNEYKFNVVSVTGISNFTSYQKINRDYFNIEEISKLRRSESKLVMSVLGGTHSDLGQQDAPLRYQDGHWSLEWYKKHRRSISSYINHSSSDELMSKWSRVVEAILINTNYEELWIPLGIGTSTDHETTRNACLNALIRNPAIIENSIIRFYYEVPYANNFPWHIDELIKTLELCGAKLIFEGYGIDNFIEIKKRLISIYASQFKMSYMAPKVEASAAQLADSKNKYGEPLLRILKLPSHFNQFDLYSGRRHVEQVQKKAKKWTVTNKNSKAITLLSPMGFGCWHRDILSITSAFPESKIYIYISESAVEETNRFKSKKVIIKPVKSNAKSWILRLIKLMIIQPRPVVIFTGYQFYNFSFLMKLLFLLSNPLIVKKPDYFSQALNRSHIKE